MKQSFTIGRLLLYGICLLAGLFCSSHSLGQGFVEDGKRYAMFTLYHYGDSDGSMQKRQIKSMEDAFANGCNSVVIGVAWDHLQPHLNSAPDWAYIDRFVQVALQNKAKIAIRMRTCRQDRVGFWPEEQNMKDTRGNIMQIEETSHARLGYTPAMDKAQDFVRSVVQHYKYLNDQGNLLFMSMTFNPQWENEYWAFNYPDGNLTSYDFNELTIGDFQRWSLAKYSGSLDMVNRSWGTTYKSAADIRPTYPNSSNQQGYIGKRGADWYTFRHQQLKTFNDRFAITVKSVDPSIRIITEQGSVYDLISPNRGTVGFKNLSELYDGVKINDGLDYIHQFSTDLLRSNVRPGGWVLNEVDGSNYLSDHIDRSNEQADMVENVFKYGTKIVTFANFYSEANGEYLKAILAKVKARGLLDQPVATVTPVGTMTYKMSTLVQSNLYESGVFGQWNTLRGGNDGKPVRILLDEDLLSTTVTVPQNQPPTVVNRVPNQTAILNKSFSYRIPDNTFADADGQITSVALSGLPAGLNYDATTRTITGMPTLVGSTEITITATDNGNASVTDYFVLAVRRATLPLQLLDPVVDCNTGRFEFRSSEGDGSTVEYAADNLFSWSTRTVYTLAEQYRAGSTLTLKARQSGTELMLKYTTTCPASSTIANKPPVVVKTLPNQGTAAGVPFIIILPETIFTDPDGTIVSVGLTGLPPGINYAPATRILEGTSTSVGNWTVVVTGTDNRGATASTTFILVVGSPPAPKTLKLLDPLLDCATGRFEFRSADGDGSPVEYAADDLYSWSTRTTYTLVDQFRYGTRLAIRARQNGVEQLLYYTTTCPSINKLPVVSVPIADQNGIVDKAMSISIPTGTFTDADGQIVSIAVSGLPASLAYNAATHLITGTVSATGIWSVTVVATDNRGATVATTFKLTIGRDAKPLRLIDPVLDCVTGLFEFRSVDGDGTPIEYSIDRLISWSTQASFTLALSMRNNTQLDIKARQSGRIVEWVYRPKCSLVNQLPTVQTPIASLTITQFRNMSLVIPANTFADADGTIDWVSLTGLPPGLMYAGSTQLLSGAPTTTGVWTLTATATDNRGGSVATTFAVTVLSRSKPLLLLAPLFDCATGRLEFQTAGGDGTPISYSIDQLLSWTDQPVYTLAEGPRYGTTLVLRVRQSGVEQTLSFTTPCTRSNKPPVLAIKTPDAVLLVNQPASFTILAAAFVDPDGTISSVTLTGLPVGLSYDPIQGTVQGTPTLIGTSPVVIIATDNLGASASDTFLITVRASPRFAVTTTLLDVQGKVIKDLVDADLLDSRKMPTLANLSCQPKMTSGSVLMELTGKARRTVYANTAPYLLYPASLGFKPDVGSYQFKVTVFSGPNGTGAMLGVAIIRFDIAATVEGGSAPQRPAGR